MARAIVRISLNRASSLRFRHIATRRFVVVFGIVTHKDRTRKSENLPLFSRVSLMRIARSLRLKSTECYFGFIEDRSESKVGIPKKRKPKVAAETAKPANH